MRLVVEVPAEGSDWRFVLLNDALEAVQHGRCSLDLLPTATQITAALPAAQLSWHALAVPKQTGGRLRSVLEGLAEEVVLSDTAALYLACANPSFAAADGKRWVMACDKAWITERIAALSAAGRSPSRLVAGLPPLQLGGQAQAWWHGDPESPTVAIQTTEGSWLTQSALLDDNARQAEHLAEPALLTAAEAWLERKVQPLAWYERLALSAGPEQSVIGNLAQFEFAHLGNQSPLQQFSAALQSLMFTPRWRALRWGIAALLLVNLVGLQFAAYQQKTAIAAKHAATQALLTQSFPEVKVVIDAPAQMRKLVDAAQLRSGQLAPTDFEVLLSTWATASAANSKEAPAAVEFRDRDLKITPSTDSGSKR